MLVPAALDGAAWRAAVRASAAVAGAGAVAVHRRCRDGAGAWRWRWCFSPGFTAARVWRRLQALAAAGLAVPHLAFAIGFGFLVMPSGLLARLLVGGDAPPHGSRVQDPWGLSLTPGAGAEGDSLPAHRRLRARCRAAMRRARLALECRAAASLGHGAGFRLAAHRAAAASARICAGRSSSSSSMARRSWTWRWCWARRSRRRSPW